MPTPEPITSTRLIEQYDALLLDAYGVLVDKQGALPGAVAFIQRLNTLDKPYYILTNSASRLPDAIATEFNDWGLSIPAKRFITSGMLLHGYFAANELTGKECVVLGPDDSRRYVEQAGGIVANLDENSNAEIIVIADQKGFDCLEGMNHALSLALRRLDAGLPLHLLLCNPDIIYPVAPRQYGFTSGGLAAMLEAILHERYPAQRPEFVRLGKPHAPIFDEAFRRSGSRNMVMVGDQLATDILGANRYGIDSVLIRSGLAQLEQPFHITPTYSLENLDS